LTAWAVQTVFDSRVRWSHLGAALSQLPLAAEIAVRALAMTAALIVVGILLQFILYAAPLRFHWLTQEWLVTTLPRIATIGFGIWFVTGAICLSSGARRLLAMRIRRDRDLPWITERSCSAAVPSNDTGSLCRLE
jgi:hypothetical protein